MNARVGVCATKAPWSASLRTFLRDHTSGVDLDILMGPSDLARVVHCLDVLVLDDVMRTFSSADVARAVACGVTVVGVYDNSSGMGVEHLRELGVGQLFPASVPPAELAAFVLQVPRRPSSGTGTAPRPLWPLPAGLNGAHRKGSLCAWTKVSGGSGSTEAVIAAASELGGRGRALLIEADEVSPVMVSRLLRDNGAGLPWALGRAGQGLRVFPDGLSGARADGGRPVGRFDAICASPGGVQPISALHMEKLLQQAVDEYDYVIVETGWLVGPSVGRDRFSSVRSTLCAADSIVVMAQADPEGAARLVQWRAQADACGVRKACCAAFGRAPSSRYERSHLAALVDSNTGDHPFDSIWFLPDDPRVARARWNAELVTRGPWLNCLRSLVRAAVPQAPSTPRGAGGHSGTSQHVGKRSTSEAGAKR